jgi:hypothetical protein
MCRRLNWRNTYECVKEVGADATATTMTTKNEANEDTKDGETCRIFAK